MCGSDGLKHPTWTERLVLLGDRLVTPAANAIGGVRTLDRLVNEHRARIDRITERMVLPRDYVE